MKIRLFFLACLCGLSGIIFFVWYHQWIIIARPYTVSSLPVAQSSFVRVKKKLFFWRLNKMVHERVALLWTDSVVDNCARLIRAWLTLLDEEELLETKSTLQSVSYIQSGSTLVISFDQLPFSGDDTTHAKLMILESLFATIKDAQCGSIHDVLFLVHHRQPDDYHLDFSAPWPLDGFSSVERSKNIKKPICSKGRRFTVMLDPAGDAQHTGRVIDGCFERGLTLQCAQALKEYLEHDVPGIRVVLTRFPGESLEALQNASFANRLHADLYIRINFYQEMQSVSSFYVYYLLYNPVTDLWNKQHAPYTLMPYNTVYKKNLSRTLWYLDCAQKSLEEYHGLPAIELRTIVGIPFKPLVGVAAPAIGFEIGLLKKGDWFGCVQPLAKIIEKSYRNVCSEGDGV